MPRSPPFKTTRRSIASPVYVHHPTQRKEEMPMGKRRSSRLRRWLRRLGAIGATAITRLLIAWRALRSRDRAVRVEVLATDRIQRKRLEREIRSAVRRLEHVASSALRCDAAVLVQRVVQGDHPVAGCSLVSPSADGGSFALIRLATHLNGRALATDDILAALAELWIGVATQQLTTPAVLVPVELEPIPAAPRPIDTLPPDPLAPRANGHTTVRPDRAA